MASKGQDDRVSTERAPWTAPEVKRLAASEAEFNPVFTTDLEGTS